MIQSDISVMDLESDGRMTGGLSPIYSSNYRLLTTAQILVEFLFYIIVQSTHKLLIYHRFPHSSLNPKHPNISIARSVNLRLIFDVRWWTHQDYINYNNYNNMY